MTTHATLSPSSAYRWRHCAPSAKLIAALPPGPSSEYADEGTAAHELAAWALTEGRPAADRIGDVIKVPSRTQPGVFRAFTVDAEMADYVQGYVDRTMALSNFAGAEFFVEQSLSIEHITGEAGATGTSDAVILIPADDPGMYDLVIRDLKYGRGVPVDAAENDQLILYAGAALAQFGVLYQFGPHSRVIMEIDQPRRGHQDRYTLTVEQLRARLDVIAADAARALAAELDAPRSAGDWCRWCPLRPTCPEYQRAATEQVSPALLADVFAGGAVAAADLAADARPADLDRLSRNMRAVEMLREWCNAVEDEVITSLNTGVAVPGWKMVLGRAGSRRWADDKKAEGKLRRAGLKKKDLYTEPALKSPAQVEKLGAQYKPLVEELVTRAEGKPVLAPEADPRPAIVVADVFASEPTNLL